MPGGVTNLITLVGGSVSGQPVETIEKLCFFSSGARACLVEIGKVFTIR